MSDNSKDEIIKNTEESQPDTEIIINGDDNFESGMLTENANDDAENEKHADADADEEISSAKNTFNYDEAVISDVKSKISLWYHRYKNTEPKKRKKLTIFFSLALILLLLILTDLIPILPNAYNRFYIGNSYTIGETQGGVYDKLGKDIIYAGNGTILSFGPDMEIKLNIESPIGTPYLETNGNNAVIYYKDLADAVVIRNGDTVKNITQDNAITASAVNANGYYGFVTDESGYESCLDVYDASGKSIYKWHTNNHIIDFSISDNGDNMVVASYEDDKHISGKLIFLSMYKDSPIKELITDGNLISEVRYIDNDTAVAFGDLYTAGYTPEGIMKWRINYNGRTLKNYDFNTNGEIAMVYDRYSSQLSESIVEIYNTNGTIIGRYESKDNIKYVSANNDYYLLSLDSETILLNDSARIKKRKATAKEYRRAVLYKNYNFAFSVSDSVAEILSVNH